MSGYESLSEFLKADLSPLGSVVGGGGYTEKRSDLLVTQEMAIVCNNDVVRTFLNSYNHLH